MSRLARRVLLLFFPATTAALITCLACAPPPEPHGKTVPYHVSPIALVRSYRDGQAGEIAYTGQRVQLRLAAGAYTVSGDTLGYPVRDSFPPAVVFVCHNPPETNAAPVTVTGVCLGADRDGVARGIGVAFRVVITDCTVTPG